MAEKRVEYSVTKAMEARIMIMTDESVFQNVFKNQEEEKRRDEFTRLFAILVSGNALRRNAKSRKEKGVG